MISKSSFRCSSVLGTFQLPSDNRMWPLTNTKRKWGDRKWTSSLEQLYIETSKSIYIYIDCSGLSWRILHFTTCWTTETHDMYTTQSLGERRDRKSNTKKEEEKRWEIREKTGKQEGRRNKRRNTCSVEFISLSLFCQLIKCISSFPPFLMLCLAFVSVCLPSPDWSVVSCRHSLD